MRCTPATDASLRMPLSLHHRGGAFSGVQPRNTREDHAGRPAAAEAAEYANAGTVELLMDEDEYFYFIEMNIPGVDLVKEQLKVAGARGYRRDRTRSRSPDTP